VDLQYEAVRDGEPSPGEVAWAWVPYEDDPTRGKRRPVLVVDTDGGDVLALQLTSKDHDRDQQQEARAGRFWMDIGSGPWDRRGRPSEVRLNRVIRFAADDLDQVDIALDPVIFQAVAAAARPYLGLAP